MNQLQEQLTEKLGDRQFVAGVAIGVAVVGYTMYKISRITAPPSPQPNGKKMDNVLVTGANAGLGFDSCRQLATDFNAKNIILCCRNATKAQKAIESLIEQTGKSSFQFLPMDTTNLEMCRAVVDSINKPLNGVILNAGGEGSRELISSGVTKQFGMNVLGHAVFVEELIAQKKLAKGARIVFIASQAARGASMPGVDLPTPTFDENNLVSAMISHINGTANEEFVPLIEYGYTKCIGALYMSYLASQFKDYVFITVSPGATSGTDGLREQSIFMQMFFLYIGPLFLSHTLPHGTLRYMGGLGVTSAHDIRDSDSGKFFASVPPGVTGRLVDQGSYFPMFADPKMHEAANEAIHTFI